MVISALEGGRPIFLELMLDIVMNVDDSSLRSLKQGLQTLCLQDTPGKNSGTVVLYLKGALMLLQKCSNLPTDTVGLINDIVCSTDCDEFSSYMKLVYFNHKCRTKVIILMEYIWIAGLDYRTLYRIKK